MSLHWYLGTLYFPAVLMCFLCFFFYNLKKQRSKKTQKTKKQKKREIVKTQKKTKKQKTVLINCHWNISTLYFPAVFMSSFPTHFLFFFVCFLL